MEWYEVCTHRPELSEKSFNNFRVIEGLHSSLFRVKSASYLKSFRGRLERTCVGWWEMDQMPQHCRLFIFSTTTAKSVVIRRINLSLESIRSCLKNLFQYSILTWGSALFQITKHYKHKGYINKSPRKLIINHSF